MEGIFILSQKEHWGGQEISSIFFLCFFFCFFLSVFSATSVDYSSFADRCNSWIELIKLKAQTIRRGSIKTSRRMFLPHYDNLRHISDFPVVEGGVSYPVMALQFESTTYILMQKLQMLSRNELLVFLFKLSLTKKQLPIKYIAINRHVICITYMRTLCGCRYMYKHGKILVRNE